MNTRWALLAVATTAIGCATAADTIDVTANIDVVRPCQRLGAVEISKGDRVATALFTPNGGRGTDWLPTLKRLAYDRGANTLYFQPGGSSGEAYLCGGSAAARVATPPTTGTVDGTYEQAAAHRLEVTVTTNPKTVQGCKHLSVLTPSACATDSSGKVQGYFSPRDCASIATIQLGGDTLLISATQEYYDAYLCKAPLIPTGSPAPGQPPGPTTAGQTSAVEKVVVNIVPDDNAAVGCTFVATYSGVECPDAIRADRAKCLAWKGAQMKGNLVVDSTPPRVYRCAQPPH